MFEFDFGHGEELDLLRETVRDFAADRIALVVRSGLVLEGWGTLAISSGSTHVGLFVGPNLAIPGLQLFNFTLLFFGQLALALRQPTTFRNRRNC